MAISELKHGPKPKPDTILDQRCGALVSLLLFLPFFMIATISILEIEPLLRVLKSVLSVDRQQINIAGRIVVFGSVFLLPVALLVNLSSMIRKPATAGRARLQLHVLNSVLSAAILTSVLVIGFWMISEAMNCANGICD